MKNSTKLKLALLKEFGHPQGPIEKDFEEESGENDVNIGNKHYHPHREEEEYGVCDECGVPAMYEGRCMECGYMEEGHNLEEEKHEVFMAQRNLETIIKAATELLHKLGNEEREVPAWVADHITKAETYVEQANDGFYFEDEDHEEPEHNDDISLSRMMESSDKNKFETRKYKTGVTVKTNIYTGTVTLSKDGMKSITVKKNPRVNRFINPIKSASPKDKEIDTLGNLMKMYLAGELTKKEDMEEAAKKPKKWIQKAINPAHKGDLHTALHIKKGEKIPMGKLNKATHSENPHLRHMAQFAKNIRKK
jgi:hypothetical protein